MTDFIIASSGSARANPVTRDVRLDFESNELDEVTIQLPFSSLQLLVRQAAEQLGISAPEATAGDPLPLGGMYRTTSYTVSKIQSGVRLTIQIESEAGGRYLNLDLDPREASLLADDIYAKVAP